MIVANQPALPPGASSEGVGRGQCARDYLIRLTGREKNLLLNSMIYFMFLPLIQHPTPPKPWNCASPAPPACRTFPTLHSVVAASFWLVVAFKTIDQRPFKAMVYFILYIFCPSICRPKQLDSVPPRAPCPVHALCFNSLGAISDWRQKKISKLVLFK